MLRLTHSASWVGASVAATAVPGAILFFLLKNRAQMISAKRLQIMALMLMAFSSASSALALFIGEVSPIFLLLLSGLWGVGQFTNNVGREAMSFSITGIHYQSGAAVDTLLSMCARFVVMIPMVVLIELCVSSEWVFFLFDCCCSLTMLAVILRIHVHEEVITTEIDHRLPSRVWVFLAMMFAFAPLCQSYAAISAIVVTKHFEQAESEIATLGLALSAGSLAAASLMSVLGRFLNRKIVIAIA